MSTSLYIQDPTSREAPFLHEKILEVCDGATGGAGAFAFVTSDGVDLLMREDNFRRFAERHPFQLIVGVDEVTNPRALDRLQETTAQLPRLSVRVFYHAVARSLFHPKFCWFRHRTKGVLLVGSGNLTLRGLRGNWEAFSIQELSLVELVAIEGQWSRWTADHAERLLLLDDEHVRTRAARNVRVRARGRSADEALEEDSETLEEPIAGGSATQRVLIAEIPRASNRWNQANFDLATFQNFFGAQPGRADRIVLQHVEAAGQLGHPESRPGVSVKSRNFRFELEAAAGLAYPRAGRPIAVFVELAPRTFRYRLLMPDDPQYSIVDGFLGRAWTGRADRMRRFSTTVSMVREAWPDSPLWRSPLVIEE